MRRIFSERGRQRTLISDLFVVIAFFCAALALWFFFGWLANRAHAGDFSLILDTKPAPIVFFNASEEILRFAPNGDIFVRGKLVESNEEVVAGIQAFLAGRCK